MMADELGSDVSSAGSSRDAGFVVRVITAVAVGALTATAIGGCSSDSKPKPSPSASTATTTAVPTTPPTSAAPVINPLTGVGVAPNGPVIAVKIDDTAAGRPSLGLDKADVIYVEEAEGGLSRMVAVFASAKPKVRAVRSVRSSDSELLSQYGRIIVVASGGGGNSLHDLDRSILHGVIFDRAQVGFSRDRSRPAPYNVVSDLVKVSAAVKAGGVRKVGFIWAVDDPRLTGAKPGTTVSTRVGSTAVGFVWDAKLARYVRTDRGQRVVAANGSPVAKPNVLVQFCQVNPDRSDVDVRGNPSAFTKSVGSGRVVLFRNGKRIEGKWSRRSIGAPTVFTDVAGKPLLFAPGGTFVALVRRGAPV
jgi:Protein of unknown function (DUF3048) N-terminal domain/Protein of unknown function (DUF3048) C-terminal domain